jgi:hypothetical protein
VSQNLGQYLSFATTEIEDVAACGPCPEGRARPRRFAPERTRWPKAAEPGLQATVLRIGFSGIDGGVFCLQPVLRNV